VRPVFFLIVLGGLLAALVAVQRPVPETDLFSAIPAGSRVPFAFPTEPELFAAKLAHGRLVPRRAIGLFGNSRSVMVGASELGAAPGRFFNYAVPGSSFRTSVALAEALAQAGKLPATVLVSLDHLEIQFDGNPNIRGAWGWLGRLARDVRIGLRRPDIDWRMVARVAWRHVYVGYHGLARYFNAEQLAAGIRWRLDGRGARAWWRGEPRADSAGYRRDGSRAEATSKLRRRLAPVGRAAPSVLMGYLIEDLRRLAALKNAGSRIIVYESPLHRPSAERLARRPSGHAVIMREAVLRACARLGLECHGNDPDGPLADAGGWLEPTHPPALALAAHLNRLMKRPRMGAARSGPAR